MPKIQVWYESEDGVNHVKDKQLKKIARDWGSTKVKAEYWRGPGYRYLTFTFPSTHVAESFGSDAHYMVGGLEWELS